MNNERDTDQWLETDMEGKDATGQTIGALISSLAEALNDAPANKRYDFQITITEHDTDE